MFIASKFVRVQWAKKVLVHASILLRGSRVIFFVSYLSVILERKGSEIAYKNVPCKANLM